MSYVLLCIYVVSIFTFLFLITQEKSKIDFWLLGGEGELPSGAQEEWSELCKSGRHPHRLVRLAAEMMLLKPRDYDQALFFASTFYSQVKFLVRRGKLPTAIAYWLAAKDWAMTALERQAEFPDQVTPISLEIVGAHAFLPSQIPLLGRFFRKDALRFLVQAQRLLGRVDAPRTDAALIYAKLYALTRNATYRESVRALRVDESVDEDKLRRIASHLCFKKFDWRTRRFEIKRDEFIKFCRS